MLQAWGKTDEDSGDCHPLAHHSMDLAAVFARMLQLPVIRNRLEAAVDVALTETTCRRRAALAFLHDIGKLHPFFRFLEFRHPGYLDLAAQVREIPTKKGDVPLIGSLDRAETRALVNDNS